MSSIRLLQDHEKGKRGQVVSVPFGVGQNMVAQGIGEYPTPGAPPAPRPTGDIDKMKTEAVAAMKSQEQAHQADLASQTHRMEQAHAAQVAELKEAHRVVSEELDAARQQLAQKTRK
jgi:hypothetical protein